MDRKKRILIVEDESLTAMALAAYLRDMGYDVLDLSATGEDAVTKAKTEKPDIVFMDVRLAGEMDGIEAAAIIDKAERIPIVFMTGYFNQVVFDRASKCGPVRFLVKPIDFKDIDEALSAIATRNGTGLV